MFDKLYLVDENELRRIEKTPILRYKDIYDAVIATKEHRSAREKKQTLRTWLEFKW
jgi:hypothetical protein